MNRSFATRSQLLQQKKIHQRIWKRGRDGPKSRQSTDIVDFSDLKTGDDVIIREYAFLSLTSRAQFHTETSSSPAKFGVTPIRSNSFANTRGRHARKQCATGRRLAFHPDPTEIHNDVALNDDERQQGLSGL
jgi:hypothetical protein